jgi:deazaflavin-dependent oxidoreductase (nitroreductase family)
VIPPRLALRVFWAVHKALDRATGGRFSTSRPSADRVGTLFLRSIGRTSGQERRNGLYYIEDGHNLIVVASNAGAANDPDWWRNLQARPDAVVEVNGRERPVRAREAAPAERARLWPELVRCHRPYAEYARVAHREIPVVILEPRGSATRAS